MQKQHIFNQQICCSQRSCSSLLFGKCGNSASKIISLVLVILTLFSFAIPVSAEDGSSEVLDVRDFTYEVYNGNDQTNDELEVTYKDGTYGTEGIWMRNYSCSSTDGIKILYVSDLIGLHAEHEYNLEFYYATDYFRTTAVNIHLRYYSNSGELIKTQVLDDFSPSSSGINFYSGNFKPNVSDIEQSYNIKLYIVLSTPNSGSVNWRISHDIILTDKDDDSGWFQKILNKINDIWESIKSLPERIGAYISNIATDIGDKIKDLFIPDEEYLQTKKEELEQFCIDHFGAVYQSLDVLIEFIVMLVNISPKEPMITFPAIDIPLFDTTYHLTDEVVYSFAWVNDKSHFLYYFYNFYRSFVTVILFLSFANYCRNKYNEVFGGGKE